MTKESGGKLLQIAFVGKHDRTKDLLIMHGNFL
jgi:hypothetical protein